MSTCLQIIQSVAKRIGLVAPSIVVGSVDPQVIQLAELSVEAGNELARRYQWQALVAESHFTTVATESQGSMDTIAPGCEFIINDTIWNRSLRRPVFGPRTPQSWQQQQAFAINGPWSSFRIIDDALHMYPVPSAGQDCYFEYISRNWVTTSGGSDSTWTADTDTPKLNSEAIVLDTIWRWKAMKGFEYGEDFNKSERRIMDLMTRDGSKDWLSYTNTKYDIYPGVVVPSGSWNL